jgi:hypothetical protein
MTRIGRALASVAALLFVTMIASASPVTVKWPSCCVRDEINRCNNASTQDNCEAACEANCAGTAKSNCYSACCTKFDGC